MDVEQPVDRLFAGGPILTMDSAAPRAEALAVRGDRILALGPEADLRERLAPGAERIDLAGRCLLPGFHDSHVHLTSHGLELETLDLAATATLDEALALVAEGVHRLPRGAWLLGSGFALQRWGVGGLDRRDLDRVSPHHPVLLRSQDHHSAWANSLAFERAGVDAATPDPDHGTVLRDADGAPSGLLLEHALELVRRAVPPPDEAGLGRALTAAGAELARRGVTTVHHMAYEPVEYWRALARAASSSDFPLRVWACVDQHLIEPAAALGLTGGVGGDGFRVGGAKFFADGALGSRTAWMLSPYAGSADCGVAVHDPATLAERFPLVIEAGFTPVTHAIGDAANRAVIDALEATSDAWRARGIRPRLEHAQHIAAEDVARAGRLGLIASVQPIHLTFDAPSVRAWLPDRVERAYPFRRLLDAGCRLVFGSDTPVATPDVVAGLRAAVERRGVDGAPLGADQALTTAEALAAYTRVAAYAIGRETHSGRLAPGFDADFVVVSHDPLDSLDDLAVSATFKAGRSTYRAGDF